MDPATLSLGETCDFTAVATLDGKPLDSADLTWEWDFGDKSELAKDNPAPHAYTAPGEYLAIVSAHYEKQSTSAKVTVIVEAYGDTKDGGTGAELRFVPADTICDLVYVKFRIPCPMGYQGQTICFDKWINGAWVQQGSGIPGGYYTENNIRYWGANREWATTADHNVSTGWQARYEIRTMMGQTISGHVDEWATPNNTVIESEAPLVIIHNPPQTHKVPWSITHAPREGPTFTVTVEICSLSGGVVATHSETQVGQGSGNWTWDGKINGVDAPKGIYTSRVYASHPFQGQGCSDRDKTDALSNVSLDGFQWVTGEYPIRAQVTLHYTLSEALTNCVVTAHKPNLSTTTVHVPTSGALSGTGGTRNVTVEFAVDPQVCGTCRFVITGDQASGAGNRDERAKPAVPEGASVDIWPPAIDWHNPGLPDYVLCCEVGATLQGMLWQGARYSASSGTFVPTADALRTQMGNGGLFCLDTHGNAGLAETASARTLAAQSYGLWSEPLDVVLSDHTGEYDRLLLVLLLSCYSGMENPPPRQGRVW